MSERQRERGGERKRDKEMEGKRVRERVSDGGLT